MKNHGQLVDDETRCKHYATEKDIIAIKFKCCNKYYPCYKCHNEAEHHVIEVWTKREFKELAIFYGLCRTEQSICSYIERGTCKNCNAEFNCGCKKHYERYFG